MFGEVRDDAATHQVAPFIGHPRVLVRRRSGSGRTAHRRRPVAMGTGVPSWLGEVHGARRVLAHDGGLHRVAAVRADREHAVVGEQHRSRAVAGERRHDRPTDRLVADDRERRDRDLAAELVGHAGDHARDRPMTRSPRGGVRRVGVHHAADVGHVPVHVGMGGGVRRRRTLAADRSATGTPSRSHSTIGVRSELLVADAGRLDHEQVQAPGTRALTFPAVHTTRPWRGQFGMQRAHLQPGSPAPPRQ